MSLAFLEMLLRKANQKEETFAFIEIWGRTGNGTETTKMPTIRATSIIASTDESADNFSHARY